MKLAELLARLPNDQLERLSIEHIRSEAPLVRQGACGVLEGIIKSFRFVQDFLIERQPPTFAIMAALLDAPAFKMPTHGFRELVMDATHALCVAVDRGEILGRQDQLRLYRRVLVAARRSELRLDPSETAILSVLRHELAIGLVEHFLLEHHTDLQEFWRSDHGFLHELNALRSAGLVFATEEGDTILAEDVAPLIRQALGIDMATADARRLFAKLSKEDLAGALASIEVKTSGSKEDLIARVLTHRLQPRLVLRSLSVGILRELCRDAGQSSSGSKDELVEKIVHSHATGIDIIVEATPLAPPEPEPRELDEQRFRALFASLKGQELASILAEFPDLKQGGSKSIRVGTLWEATRSEQTYLSVLTNRDLEDILYRLGLKMGGSKTERIDRLVARFATGDLAELRSEPEEGNSGSVLDVAANVASAQTSDFPVIATSSK